MVMLLGVLGEQRRDVSWWVSRGAEGANLGNDWGHGPYRGQVGM